MPSGNARGLQRGRQRPAAAPRGEDRGPRRFLRGGKWHAQHERPRDEQRPACLARAWRISYQFTLFSLSGQLPLRAEA